VSGVNGVDKAISDTATTIGTVFGGNNDEPAPKPRARGTKRGAQGGAQKDNLFSTALSFLPGPFGAIAGLLGGVLGSK
jgi:hypothetical protein